MSALVLPDQGSVLAHRFAILGAYRKGTRFVKHVGILRAKANVAKGVPAQIYHVQGGKPFAVDDFCPDVLASFPDLISDDVNSNELKRGERWLNEICDEVARAKDGKWPDEWYAAFPAHPNSTRFEAGKSQYSCIGFVLHLYEVMLGTVLIDQNCEMPRVELATLEQIFETSREHFPGVGLNGSGPWPVMLPGHVFHACDAENASLPYIPKAEDLCFPAEPYPTCLHSTQAAERIGS